MDAGMSVCQICDFSVPSAVPPNELVMALMIWHVAARHPKEWFAATGKSAECAISEAQTAVSQILGSPE